jgi:hypothetical protein
MEKDEKIHEIHEEFGAIETPLFDDFKVWWRAKKESLDLLGIEKYFGFDNSKFKSALNSYRNLLQEIEHEFKEETSVKGLSQEEIEEARRHRESMLLDAKRDFVYNMPENYRIWFKKNKIFHSWRTVPESWGFEESRYWGSRSGLTQRERRVLYSVLAVCVLGLIFMGVKASQSVTPMSARDDRPARDFKIAKDSIGDADSLFQARILRERKEAEEKRAKKAFIEKKNHIINDMNNGSYTTLGTDMRSEVAFLMKVYNENIYKQYLSEEDYVNDLEVLGTTLVMIERKNPGLVTQVGDFRLPLLWKPDTTIKISWDDIEAGLQIIRNRSSKKQAPTE